MQFYTTSLSKLRVTRKWVTSGTCPRFDPRSRGKPSPQNGFEWAVEGINAVDFWWHLMALLVTDTSPGDHMEETECWSSGEWSGKSCVNHLHRELAPYALRSPRKNVDYKRGELRSVLRMRTETVRNLVQRRGSGIAGWIGTANETRGKPRESYVLIRQRWMCFKKVRVVNGCQMLLWSNGQLDTSLLVGEWTSLLWLVLCGTYFFPI